MANALTGFALYAALCKQVYRRAYVKDHADQPLAIPDDGSPSTGLADQILGQTLVDPKGFLQLDTDPLTKGRFLFNNNYIYDVSNGFVAMVTRTEDDKYTVTFRGTDAGDTRPSDLLDSTFGPGSPPERLDQLDCKTNVTLGPGHGLNDSQAQDAINLTKMVIVAAGGNPKNVTVAGQSLGGLAGIISSVLGVKGYGFDPAPFGKQVTVSTATTAIQDVIVG